MTVIGAEEPYIMTGTFRFSVELTPEEASEEIAHFVSTKGSFIKTHGEPEVTQVAPLVYEARIPLISDEAILDSDAVIYASRQLKAHSCIVDMLGTIKVNKEDVQHDKPGV